MSVSGARLFYHSDLSFPRYDHKERRMIWFICGLFFTAVFVTLLPRSDIFRAMRWGEKLHLRWILPMLGIDTIIFFWVAAFGPFRRGRLDYDIPIGWLPWPLPFGIIVRSAFATIVTLASAFLLFLVSGSGLVDGREVELNDWWVFGAAIALTLHSSCLWRILIGGGFNFALMSTSADIVMHMAVDRHTRFQYLGIVTGFCVFLLFCAKDLIHRADRQREQEREEQARLAANQAPAAVNQVPAAVNQALPAANDV